jgi:lysozyme family protein
MADFNTAVVLTLRHEGGYVNDSNDAGGATNMGIEQRDVPGIPIQTLTVAQAIEYYQEHFWNPLYNGITSQDLASKLFDMGVLFGVKTAVMLLQQMTTFKKMSLTIDGEFGPNTLTAVNASDPAALLALFKNRLVLHARSLVAAHPTDQEFLEGWLTRIYS